MRYLLLNITTLFHQGSGQQSSACAARLLEAFPFILLGVMLCCAQVWCERLAAPKFLSAPFQQCLGLAVKMYVHCHIMKKHMRWDSATPGYSTGSTVKLSPVTSD